MNCNVKYELHYTLHLKKVMSERTIDLAIHYDSSIDCQMVIDLPPKTKWVGYVTHLHFALEAPEGEEAPKYNDPTAYLELQMGNETLNTPYASCVNQAARKGGSYLMPIGNPGEKNVIRTVVRGGFQAKDTMTFRILDKELKEVACARVVVTLRIMTDLGTPIIL